MEEYMAEYTPLSIKDKQHLAILSEKLKVATDADGAQNTEEIVAEIGRIKYLKFDFIRIFLKVEKRLIISDIERLRRILDAEMEIAQINKEEEDSDEAIGAKVQKKRALKELLYSEYSLIRSRRTRHYSSAVTSLENTQGIFVNTNNQERLQEEIERIEAVLQSAEQHIENEEKAWEAQPLEALKQAQALEKKKLEKILSDYKKSATGLRALGEAMAGRSFEDSIKIDDSENCGVLASIMGPLPEGEYYTCRDVERCLLGYLDSSNAEETQALEEFYEKERSDQTECSDGIDIQGLKEQLLLAKELFQQVSPEKADLLHKEGRFGERLSQKKEDLEKRLRWLRVRPAYRGHIFRNICIGAVVGGGCSVVVPMIGVATTLFIGPLNILGVYAAVSIGAALSVALGALPNIYRYFVYTRPLRQFIEAYQSGSLKSDSPQAAATDDLTVAVSSVQPSSKAADFAAQTELTSVDNVVQRGPTQKEPTAEGVRSNKQ